MASKLPVPAIRDSPTAAAVATASVEQVLQRPDSTVRRRAARFIHAGTPR